MELMDVLRNRRAVRDYTDARLSRPVLERLIGAATLAPSAMNLQPWGFAALLDPERIAEYAGRARKWSLENLEGNGRNHAERQILQQPEFNMFYHAPALVMVLAEVADGRPSGQAIDDCCLAAENLMLAARDEGSGSCWIGLSRPWLNLLSTKKELALPQSCQIVAPIVPGYPRAWPETHGRNKANIHWI